MIDLILGPFQWVIHLVSAYFLNKVVAISYKFNFSKC